MLSGCRNGSLCCRGTCGACRSSLRRRCTKAGRTTATSAQEAGPTAAASRRSHLGKVRPTAAAQGQARG